MRSWQQQRLKKYTDLITHALNHPDELKKIPGHIDLLHAYINSASNNLNLKKIKNRELIEAWVKEKVIPKIQTASKSVFWYQRYLAAKALQCSITPIQEDILDDLLHDQRPCVVVEAVVAMQRMPSEKLINSLIDKIARLQRKNHEFYFDLFVTMPDSIRDLVEKRLGYERRFYERALCYDLLRFFPKPRVYPTAYNDAKNSNVELAIAAIKHICRAEQPSEEIIQSWLDDSREDLVLTVFAKIAEHRWNNFKSQIKKYGSDSNIKIKLGAQTCLKLLEE